MIKYCKGYKYQLREDFETFVKIHPKQDIHAPLVSFYKTGRLIIRKYFAWNGCSGPTWDDRSNMQGCLIHDAFYYLMRIGKLDTWHRYEADEELYRFIKEDGKVLEERAMEGGISIFEALKIWFIAKIAPFRSWYYELSVNLFAEHCANPQNARKIHTAP